MVILLNAVRVLGNNQHSILHKISTRASFVICTQYIPSMYIVRTGMYRVCTTYCHKNNQSAANLWVEGMEALLGEIKGIASCTHHTPEQLRLPFHTAKCSQSTVHDMCMKYMVELHTGMYLVHTGMYLVHTNTY